LKKAGQTPRLTKTEDSASRELFAWFSVGLGYVP